MPRKNVFKRNEATAARDEQPGGPEGNGAASPVNAPEATDQGWLAPLPLFYKEPRPLQVELHGGKAIKRQIDYRFAASAHAVVLHTREFRLAAASYPIIFTDDAPAMPLAVLGYQVGQNVFVNDAGQWASGALSHKLGWPESEMDIKLARCASSPLSVTACQPSLCDNA